MQAMSDRSGGAWHPSRGVIYPTIAQLEDGGMVTAREEGGRRFVATSEGRGQLEERSPRLGDSFAGFAAANSLVRAVAVFDLGRREAENIGECVKGWAVVGAWARFIAS
jgi:DNA-binding PadR family transcriptional regulator